MRRLLLTSLTLFGGGALLLFGTGAANGGEYRVRAIFDNANQVTVGEQVRVAGVTIGVIEFLNVTDDNKAALTLRIDNPAYRDFKADASCTIRPQSLIGEQFVECSPTSPKADGAPPAPPLKKIESGDGAGEYLLPVSNTSSPVGVDLINNIMRVPERQRFALILNEFGIALAGNGENLNQVIRRGYPALQQTNKVLKILAGQNELLARLAVESDQSLAPLAEARTEVSGTINSSEKVGRATAEEGAALQENWAKFPAFLKQLTPSMASLEQFSRALRGFLQPLQGHESQINSVVANFPGLSKNSIPAINSLSNPAASTATTVLKKPDVIQSLNGLEKLATGAKPLATNLGSLLDSFQDQGGWEFLMQALYFQTGTVNGYNKYGHYARGEIVLYPVGACAVPAQGRSNTYGACSANFDHGVDGSASAAAATAGIASLSSMANDIAGLFGVRRVNAGVRGGLTSAQRKRLGMTLPAPPHRPKSKPKSKKSTTVRNDSQMKTSAAGKAGNQTAASTGGRSTAKAARTVGGSR